MAMDDYMEKDFSKYLKQSFSAYAVQLMVTRLLGTGDHPLGMARRPVRTANCDPGRRVALKVGAAFLRGGLTVEKVAPSV